MLVLYIIFGIILIINLMLVLPISVRINNFDENETYIKYAFLKFKLNKTNEPIKREKAKEEPVNTNKIKAEKNKTNLNIKNIFKKFTLKEFINLAKNTIKEIIPPVKFILKHIKIYNLNLYLGICGEDTFDAANKTGLASSFSYPIFYYICQNIKNLSSYNLKIEPLFLEEESKIKLNIKISFLPLFIIFPSLKILIKLLKFRNIVLK